MKTRLLSKKKNETSTTVHMQITIVNQHVKKEREMQMPVGNSHPYKI